VRLCSQQHRQQQHLMALTRSVIALCFFSLVVSASIHRSQNAYWTFSGSEQVAVSGSSIAAISNSGNVTVLSLEGKVVWANFPHQNGRTAKVRTCFSTVSPCCRYA
jgi:hypothetical protein